MLAIPPFRSRWRAFLASARVQALLFLLAPTVLFIATRPFVVATVPDDWWQKIAVVGRDSRTNRFLLLASACLGIVFMLFYTTPIIWS